MTPDQDTRRTTPAEFMAGEWLVQPSLGRISQGDRVVRIRPQLMDILVLLASRPGRTFSKHDILDVVWAEHHVVETGLIRCMAELRQALGDDAQQPTYIETISKRGYRLIAPVRRISPPEDETAPSGAEGGTADATREGATGTGDGSDRLEPRGGPDGRLGASRGPAWRHVGRAILRRRWLAAVVLVLAATLLLVWLRPRWWAPRLTDRDSLVLTFENRTGDPVFDGTLRLGMAVQLAQSPRVHLVSERRLRAELEFMRRGPDEAIPRDVALELCQRVDAKALVAGSIASIGQRYVIGIEGVECRSGEVLAHHQVQADRKEDVLARLGQGVSAIRERFGESLASIGANDVPLVQATTASLDALKAFSEGDQERSRGRDAEAIRAYQRAVAIDAGFALAHSRLGLHLLNLGRTGEAVDSLRRAFALRDRVSAGERLYITAFYHSRVLRDPVRALAALEAWSAAYPSNALARFSLASMYGQVGRFEDSLKSGQEALRLDPGNAMAQTIVLEALTRLGRLAEGRALARELLARSPGSANAREYLMQIAFVEDDGDTVRRQLEWSAGVPDAATLFDSHRVAMAMFGGRVREATGLARQRAEAAAQRGDSTLAALVLAEQAVSLALVGLGDDARALATTALDRARHPAVVAQAALALAIKGETAEAQRLLDEHTGLPDVDAGSDAEASVPARALIAIHRGRPDVALDVLASVAPYEAGARFRFLPAYVRGLAHMRAGRAREAAGEFSRMVAHRGALADAPIYPLAWVQLARSRAVAGDLEASRTAYARFFGFWSGADAGIPLLVEARRESGVRS